MITGSAATVDPATTLSVEDLKHRTAGELEAMYRELPEPEGVKQLEGKPKGEMLAITGLDWKPVRDLLRIFGDSPVFPWLGKGFASRSEVLGSGNNRLNLLGYKPEIFDFKTKLDHSVLDSRGCVLLDYDVEENPLPIRQIRDELREVSPGLWFGPAMVNIGDNYFTVLWFAVDFNQ